jgi:hypothetical protein
MQGTSAGTMGHGEGGRQLHDALIIPLIAIGGQISGAGSHWRTVVTQGPAKANSAPSCAVRL